MIQKERYSAHALTEKDLRAILSTIDRHSPENPWKDSSIRERNFVILMLLFFGLRSREILQMRIYDIDLSSGLLRIGHERSELKIKRALPQHLLDLLRRYLLHHCYLGKKVRAQDHDYVFRSERSGKRLMPQDLKRIFTVLQEKVPGLSTKITTSAFRYAYIKSALADDALVDDRPITRYGTPSSRVINYYCASSHIIYGAAQGNNFDLKKKLKLKNQPKNEK